MLKRFCDICGGACAGEREALLTGIESVLYDLGIEDSCAACVEAAGKVDWASVILRELAVAPVPAPLPVALAVATPACVPPTTAAYTGFLFIRCEKCGAEKAYCAKIPTGEYRCGSCGAVTRLENLTRAEMYCECGNHSWYKTNVTDWGMDIPCVRCHAPVALEYTPEGKFRTIDAPK